MNETGTLIQTLTDHSIATVNPVKSVSVLLPEAPAGFMAMGDDDICLAIAAFQIYPSFSQSLRHSALKQSRQEEHFIL